MKFIIFITLCLPTLLHAQLSVTIVPRHIPCYGAANGKAKASPAGGTAPYTYIWSNGGTAQTIGLLTPGTYTVTVQDANLLAATASATITEPAVLQTTTYGQSQLCEVAPDGFAATVAYGGTPGYTYLWSNGGTTSQINQLTAGTYTVTVTDAHHCTTTGAYTLNYWADGVFLLTNTQAATCAYEDGAASVTPFSGTPPYLYQWDTGSTDSTISGVAAGVYHITVTDSNGCIGQIPVHINDNAAYTIIVDLPEPFCLNQTAIFSETIPAIYPEITWTLDTPLDQILEGQGTDSIRVQWANTGYKTLTLEYGANGIVCGTLIYTPVVAVCAGVSTPSSAMVKVSPNPFADFLKIDLPAGTDEPVDVAMFDFSGKMVLKTLLNAASSNLRVYDLPAGIYSLKITNGKLHDAHTIVKN